LTDEVGKMAKRTRGTQGTKRMLELGYKPMQLWLSPSLRQQLGQEADRQSKTAAGLAREIVQNFIAQQHVLRS
jgi:hypothetical protein